MKVFIKETEPEGLESFLGKKILVLTAGYFYDGLLVGVNDTCIKLEDPAVVFGAGEWNKPGYSTKEKMIAKHWYISRSLIESFGESRDV